LFNYPSLIKTLNVSRLKTHVEKWLGYFGYYSPDLDEPHHFSLICPQYYDRENYGYYDKENLKVICISLFKMFTENNASLSNLYMTFDSYYRDSMNMRDICGIILDHPKLISNIKRFSFNCQEVNSSDWRPLPFLSSSTSIKHIELTFRGRNLEKYFANIIQSQSQLSSIIITNSNISSIL